MEVNAQLLKKYWSGGCTSEEKARVEAWLKEGAPDAEFAIRGEEEQTKDRVWSSIMVQRELPPKDLHIPIRTTSRYFWPVAASMLAILSFAAAFLYNRSSITTQEVQYVEVVAEDGQHATITLADGSEIVLNSRSRLRYPKTFDGAQRKVFLEGEGYFDIAKNPEKPFTVATQQLTVRVLGTQFNIKEIDGQHAAVAVSEGKVKVVSNALKDSLLLVANQYASLSEKGLSIVNRNNDQSFAWKTGELILDDLTLEQTTIELERRYGISIQVTDRNLLQKKIRAVFHKESMPEVIRLIAAALDTSYDIKNKEVTLGS